MLRVFYGDNRIAIQTEVRKILGENYEVLEGVDLTPDSLPNIFWGSSLFSDDRNILIKDMGENRAVWDLLPQYLETPHQIVIWETKLDKRTAAYKALTKAKVKIQEFTEAQSPDARLVFGILDTAWTNGKQAVKTLEKIENIQDPYMFMGLLTTQAIKKFRATPTRKARQVLKNLATTDMQLKTTTFAGQPWSLIKAFLLEIQEIK